MSFSEVTELRKAGKLSEAYELAKRDLDIERSEWSLSAMFWVLRDLCKKYLDEGNQDAEMACFNALKSTLDEMDDYEGYAQKAFDFLNRKLTPNSSEVLALAEKAKNGEEEMAYNKVMEMHANSPLPKSLHDDLGWIIFRYLKRFYRECGSEKARRALFSYLKLENERPSLLHSQILNLATQVCENYDDFKFLPFMELWGVNTFRYADYRPSQWDDKQIAPLVERVLERCVNMGYSLDDIVNAFSANQDISTELIFTVFSRKHFFEVNKQTKESFDSLSTCVNTYLEGLGSKEMVNEYHSRILFLYIWKLPEDREVEFVDVFNKWGVLNFTSDDWERSHADDKEFPSLVEKAIRVYVNALKKTSFSNADENFAELLKRAIAKYSDNDQLQRSLALLFVAKGKTEEAQEIYRQLLLTLNRYYVWKELAESTDDKTLKVSALCKAITIEKEDGFLGEIHLELARLLINDEKYSEAKRELETFASTYRSRGWGLKEPFGTLTGMIPAGTKATDSNQSFYLENIKNAEEFVYANIPWTTMVVSEVFHLKREGRKDVIKAKLVSSDGKNMSINLKHLNIEKRKAVGTCVNVKIYNNGIKDAAVLISPSDADANQLFKVGTGYVDYFNRERKCHYVYSPSGIKFTLQNTPVRLEEKEYCNFLIVPGNDKYPIGIFVEKVSTEEGIKHFPQKIGVVDGVNESKQLFHCVFGYHDDIIIKFNQSPIQPKVGDFLNVAFVVTKNKEGKDIKKPLSIELGDDTNTDLKKSMSGVIRVKTNLRGQKYGFVENCYVPSNLIESIDDGDPVNIDAVFDGENWRAYSLSLDIF